jgi:DNA phosphorothioation system restriction enzyme
MELADLDIPVSAPPNDPDIIELLSRLLQQSVCVEWGCVAPGYSLLSFLSEKEPTGKGLVVAGNRTLDGDNLPPALEVVWRKLAAGVPSPLCGWDAWVFFFKGSELVLATFSETEQRLRFIWSWGDPHRSAEKCYLSLQDWLSQPETLDETYEDLNELSELDALQSFETSGPSDAYCTHSSQTAFQDPDWLDLRDYQKEAMQAWIAAGGRGVLAMATGAGKTLTALSLAARVAEKNRPFVVIVICPYINLAIQWIKEMKGFGLRPIECFGSRNRWECKLRNGYQRLSNGLSDCMSLVVSNATFLSDFFQSRLQTGTAHHLLIADEMHNLGAERLRKALPQDISLRLGLSATPQRHGDEEGTQALMDYFGEVVYRFDLKDAIQREILVPYHYHPILVELTNDEAEEYQELTHRIARAWQGEDAEQTPALKLLLIKRAKLIASASNKLPALRGVLANLKETLHKAIVYCGDGNTEVDGELERQLLAVTKLMGEEFTLKVRQFTFRETTDEREGILKSLQSDDLDAVVAIRCLDEGIDLPDVRFGFLLASSTNPRQFIQRRGRLLRRAQGKELAEIYDFIVCPPSFGGDFDDEAYNLERRTFARELGRILEFCETAENGPVALKSLQHLRIEYNLLAL